MRICLYSHDFPPLVGGLGTFTSTLADYLTSRGEIVTVLTNASDPVHWPANYKVVRRPNILQIWKEVAASEVLHMNGFALLPALAAILMRRPILWAHYEYDTICPIGLAWWEGRQRSFRPGQCIRCMTSRGLATRIPKRFLMMYVRRAIARTANVNLQPSQFILERQAQPRSILVPHAVDVARFKPLLSNHSNKGAFLFCGRLIEEKGLQVLLHAVQLCRRSGSQVELRVRGEGPYSEHLSALTSELRLTDAVTFLGFARGSELVDELQSAYALIVPSIWDEVTGIVALEAMACGTPVIASKVGGLGELAIKGGLVVERGDVNALADSMMTLYHAPQLRNRLAREAVQAMISDHSVSSIGAKHLSILHRLSVAGPDEAASASHE